MYQKILNYQLRLPVHRVEDINKLERINAKLTIELGHEPSKEDLAKVMGVSAERIEELLFDSQEIYSLDKPIGEDKDATIKDMIQSEQSIEEDIELKMQTMLLKDIMRRVLTEREYRVLALRTGLETGRELTLEEVGKIFGVTRERIRQIESKAYRRLRIPVKRALSERNDFQKQKSLY